MLLSLLVVQINTSSGQAEQEGEKVLIGINPSSQGFNQVGQYNEAIYCNDIADRVVRLGNAQGLNIKKYWGGDQKTGSANINGLRRSLCDAKTDGVTHLLSFHTDSAGNKNNDGRGYTGTLMLWRTASGKEWGDVVVREASRIAQVPYYANRERTDLMVLRNFQTSALIEIMNHSDPDDLKLLLNDEWRELYAKGLVEGLCKYFNKKYVSPNGESNKKNETKEEDMSFQAVPSKREPKEVWYDGLFTGVGDYGKGRVFVVVRVDPTSIGTTFEYCIISKDKSKKIEWSKAIFIAPDNRPFEFEIPQNIGNFSLHIRASREVMVAVNQMYK